MDMVERNYCDGVPPHQLPEARETKCSNQRSHLFVTTPDMLGRLTPVQIQDIFRHRHILVTGEHPSDSTFDREALSRLGSLEVLRKIEGVPQPKKDMTELH